MTDPLVKAALLGSGKAAGVLPATGTAVDPLVARLPEGSPERRLLLAAGARAVHRLAGWRPASGSLPAPAPTETRSACPPAVAAITSRLLDGEHRELLPEACGRIEARGWRLPHALLAAALAPRGIDDRKALRPLLGERGLWLAGMREGWEWALPAAQETAEEQKRLWDEENFEARTAVLRRVRAADPARGREWLAPVLSKEKADERTALVMALATGLSTDDETLLEKMLDDRASSVRAAAASLLAGLPGSAFAARQRARAEALLAYEAPAGGLWSKVASLVRRGGGKLTAELPQEIDKSWKRDGIPANPANLPSGVGKRAFWLIQLLWLIPPRHWSERFKSSPADLVAAAVGGEWSGALLQGWSRAAVRFHDVEWSVALWDAGRAPNAPPEMHPLLLSLLGSLAPADREARVSQLLTDPPDPRVLSLSLAVNTVPAPWSPAFARGYLDQVRRAAGRSDPGGDPWMQTLGPAALRMPREVFDTALAPWPIDTSNAADTASWGQKAWARAIEQLTDIVRLRQTLWKETTP